MLHTILRQQTVAVILAGGKGSRLEPLTRDRAKPAVPFGGVYRIIDFSLSNCLNSNLRKIHVLTQYKAMSLDRHINCGWQRYFCRELGEFVDVVPPQQRIDENWYQGTADAVYQNIYGIEKENPLYVVILAGDHIYKMDYQQMIRRHIQTDADITVGAMAVRSQEAAGTFGVMEVNTDGRLVGFEEKPVSPRSIPGNPEFCLASMGIYVFTARFLFEQLCRDANRLDSKHDFGSNIIPESIETSRVFAYPFLDENNGEVFDETSCVNSLCGVQGESALNAEKQSSSSEATARPSLSPLSSRRKAYWRDVGQLDSYYDANMDLISVQPQLNLYDNRWPIRTYHPDLPPAKFVFSEGDRRGWAMDSIVGQGTIVSGGEIRHSVLGHSVRVNSFAQVEDSIVFNETDIGRRAKIRRCIINRGVHIPPGLEIGFDPQQDRRNGFHVTPGGITVVTQFCN